MVDVIVSAQEAAIPSKTSHEHLPEVKSWLMSSTFLRRQRPFRATLHT